MKNKSAGFYSSSLEMLLDTMCNMLGGVVFIALMVAVVAQDATALKPSNESAATQLTKTAAAVAASNTVVQAQLQAARAVLQDPQRRPQTNLMRLPNLENTTRQPWLVILQYGQAFPVNLFSQDGRAQRLLNSRAVLYQPQTHFVEARPNQGEDPVSAVKRMAQEFRTQGRTNYYFTFWVYADSFPAFTKARETAIQQGWQYGWNPLPENQLLQLNLQGERVLPQN